MEDAEVVLRRAPLFNGLDDESARTLRRQTSEVKLARGEHLFLEGQDGDRLYVVLDGKIKLTRAAVDGRENLLSVLGPGEMFGELSLFDPRPRTSSASAVTDATLAALAHDALRPWLLERPQVSMHMLQALARRLRRANDVTADLVFTDVPGRVAKNLTQVTGGLGANGDAATAMRGSAERLEEQAKVLRGEVGNFLASIRAAWRPGSSIRLAFSRSLVASLSRSSVRCRSSACLPSAVFPS